MLGPVVEGKRRGRSQSDRRLDLARPVRYSIAAMTLYLTPFVLIGALIVLGVLVGVGLVLFAPTRERPDARPAGDETPDATDGDRAA
jgi:hypothetical protein